MKLLYIFRKKMKGKTFRNVSDVKRYFDKTKDTKLITHGWMSSGKSDYCTNLTKAYLQKSDYNLIIMDWSAISGININSRINYT